MDWFSYALMFAVTAACVALSKIKLGTILKGLKPLIFIIVLTACSTSFTPRAARCSSTGGIHHHHGGHKRAFLLIVRIMMLLTGTSLTYTTSP